MEQKKDGSVAVLLSQLDEEFKKASTVATDDQKSKKSSAQKTPKKIKKTASQRSASDEELSQKKLSKKKASQGIPIKLQETISTAIGELQNTIQQTADEIFDELSGRNKSKNKASAKKENSSPDKSTQASVKKQSQSPAPPKSADPDKDISSPTQDDLQLFHYKTAPKKQDQPSENTQSAPPSPISDKEPPLNTQTKNEWAVKVDLSDNLKIAESRIKKLEDENDQLKLSNQELVLAGEALKENLDQMSQKNEDVKVSYEEELKPILDQKNDLEAIVRNQSQEIEKLKSKNNKLQEQLGQDIQHIRFKERELENRLELKQNEMEALLRQKDNKLLELKQEIDQMKIKNHTLLSCQKQIKEEKQASIHKIQKTVRTLQMCIHFLKNTPTAQSSLERGKNKEKNFPPLQKLEPVSKSQNAEKNTTEQTQPPQDTKNHKESA